MAVLEHPADIVRYVLEHVYGETDPLAYEPLSWAETRAEQAAAGIVWAIRLLPTPFTEFCAQVARQSNADLYQSAGLWVYRWRMRRTAVAIFTTARNVTAPLTFGRRPPRTALAARLGVSWELEHATGQFRASEVYVSALASRLEPAQLGRRVTTDAPIDLPLPYVLSPVTARYLGRTALTRVEQQRWTVELQTDWDALPLEKGDTILVDSPLLVASLGTSLGTFVVTAKRYDPATDAIVLEAEEAPTALYTRTLSFAIRARQPGTTRLLTFAMQRLAVSRTLTFAVEGETGPAIAASPGAYSVTGRDATLTAEGQGPAPLAAVAGTYGVTGAAATLSIAGGGGGELPTAGLLLTWGNTGSPPFSRSITTGPTDTYLLVWLHYSVASTIVTQVLFGATSLTQRARITSSQGCMELWSGAVPASTTANVVVHSHDQYFAGIIAAYGGVTGIGTVKTLVTPTANSSTLTFDENLSHARYVDGIGTLAADADPVKGGPQTADVTAFIHQGIQLDASHVDGSPSVTWTGLTHSNAPALHIGVPLIGTA